MDLLSTELSPLVAHRPGLPIDSESVTLLETPGDYYCHLLKKIRSAKKEIILCALYFGGDVLELDLMKALVAALDRVKDLKVKVLFDYCRNTRKEDTSLSSLCSHLSGHFDRVDIRLYKMPITDSLFGMVPSPLNEVLGVFHCKFSVIDDDIFFTGANLSHNYFTDRQDRYLVINNSKVVRKFLQDFFRIVSDSAHTIDCYGTVSAPRERRGTALRDKLLLLTSGDNSFMHMNTQTIDALSSHEGTSLYPLLQFCDLGIETEMEKIVQLLDQRHWKEIVLSSPYCSYTPGVADALCRASQNGTSVCILASSRNAHGFSNAKGLRGLVPEFHDLSLLDLINRLKGRPNIKTMTYDRPGWSFHAKGLWCFPRDSRLPTLSYIGSSNGGERSWRRDFELGFLISTTNPKLNRSITSELNLIMAHCSLIKTEQEIVQQINMLSLKKFFHKFVKSYL